MTTLAPPIPPPVTAPARPWLRWRVAAAAVLVHLCIGSVYAYSVFQVPLHQLHGWTKPQATWAFSLAILTLGLTAAIGGKWMLRLGPRRCAMLAALGWGGGLMLAGLAAWAGKLWLFWLGYGLLGGAGLGLGYAPPVTALIHWFPDRRGLATGLAVCGFGFGALICAHAASALMSPLGLPLTFVTLGAVYGCAIFAASLGLRLPDPAVSTSRDRKGAETPSVHQDQPLPHGRGSLGTDLNLSEALRTSRFWLLWTMFFLNICAGIMLINLASPMAQEMHHLTAAQAAALVGVSSVANGLGRLGWSAASDFLGRSATFMLMFLLQIGAFLALPALASAGLFEADLALILTCYGAGFAISPAFLADMFGKRNVGAIYGVLLTAWGIGGVVGPQLGARLREATHSYTASLHVITAGLALALVLAIVLRLTLARTRTQQA
jgi:OFA family oxalate/formate antiporter-like MFS transporter